MTILINTIIGLLNDPRVSGNTLAFLCIILFLVFYFLIYSKEKKESKALKVDHKKEKDATLKLKDDYRKYKLDLEDNHFSTIKLKLSNIKDSVSDVDRTIKALHVRMDKEVKRRDEKDEAQNLKINGLEIKMDNLKETVDKLG